MEDADQTAAAKIQESIKKAIPDCEPEKAAALANFLITNDFKSLSDLKLVQMDDIRHLVSLGQGRKLINYWAKTALTERTARTGHSSYNVKWTNLGLTDDAFQRLNNNKQLTKDEIDHVVRVIVEDVKSSIPNVKRGYFADVAMDMADRYEHAFKDIVVQGKTTDKRNLTSADKIQYKLQNRFDNEKKKNTRTCMEIEAPRRTEAYGCIRWQVVDLPDDETLETLNEKREDMKMHFLTTARNQWNWRGLIRENLSATYALQRRDINSQCAKRSRGNNTALPPLPGPVSMSEIAEEWPFLFVYDGMIHHIQLLTGKSFKTVTSDWLPSMKDEVIDFLAKNNTENEKIRSAMHRAIRRKTGSDPELTAIVLMLTKKLKEDSKGIMQHVAGPLSVEQVPQHVNLPDVPFILAEGKSWFHAKKFFFCVDGAVRGTASSFSRALGLLFCSYFVFNLKYNEKAARTLDFIQRSMLDINPEKGSKVPNKARGKKKISFKLLQLFSSLQAYRENIAPSGGSSEEDV